MNLREWNEALFKGLVKDVGSAGDPLYFYVDDVVLAHISGIEDPEEAVEDFSRAFEAIDFEQSAREALAWRRRKYEGTPVFLAAMAITVLAVTLEPIGGNSSNVYRRQNKLLGHESLGGGVPDGYEQMDIVWSVWEDFLESPDGRKYGSPTAKRTGRYTHQSFARSQAFIRFQDKQDINNFLEEESANIPKSADGLELVRRLGDWLEAQGSHSRLARMCAKESVQDELGGVLLGARKFWGEEQEVRTKATCFEATPLWDTYDEGLHLVVPLEGVKGTHGASYVNLNLEEYELEAGEKYMFLSTPYTEATSWLRDPIDGQELNEAWAVSWNPPENGLYVFVEDEDEDAWIGADAPTSSGTVRILVDEERLDELLRKWNPKAAKKGLELATTDSGANGFAWLTVEGEAEVPGHVALMLLGAGSAERRDRNHSLRGGLRMVGNAFLNGFEPDVVIGAEVMESAMASGRAPQILVDGADLWSNAVLEGHPLEARVSLADEFLHPGRHKVVVRVEGEENTSHVISQPAETPALFPPISRKHRREHILRFSLERSQNPMVFVLPEGGEPLRLEFAGDIRYWLQILEKSDPDAVRFESFFDSSWLDWLVAPPGQPSEDVLFVARSADNEPWQVLQRRVSMKALETSPRVHRLSNPTGWELLELFGDKAKYQEVSPGAKKVLQGSRREHSRLLTDLFRHRNDGPREARGRRPLTPRKWRPDTERAGTENPYEYLLWWLTEKGEEGVSTPIAEASFAWLCRRAGLPEVPDFKRVIYNLEALGHVVRQKGRIHVLPARMNWLPDSEALVALSGARSEDMVSVLEHGATLEDPDQESVLAAVDTHVFTQTGLLEEGRTLRVPVAPRTVFAQLGSRLRGPGEQAHTLGFELYDPSLHELEGLPGLQEALTDESRAMTLSGVSDRVDLFTPRRKKPGGRWRRLTEGLASLEQDSFLRAFTPAGRRYMWWTKDQGLLVDCGWLWGLWGFHQGTPTEDLIAVEPEKDRFAVRDFLRFPPDYERFLVMRSGLLPREAKRKRDPHRRRRNAAVWRVYTNVPTSIAAEVSAKMGHAWSKSKGSWPVELGDLEFQ